MKFLKQFAIILFISFLGEVLNVLVPLPIPATVWGMVLMFLALWLKILRLDQVEETADFFMSIIAMLFIPFGVSLMSNYELLAQHTVPILIITFVSFFICFAVTGKVADRMIEKQEKKGDLS